MPSITANDYSTATDYVDVDVAAIEQQEKDRQRSTIELVASENYAHPAVLRALSSSLQNKYSEGQVNQRYYGGCANVDAVELLCMERARQVFGLDEAEWTINTQCLSGATANFTVFSALAGPNGRIMGLKLSDGGHLTHGHSVSSTSKFFQSIQYSVDPKTFEMDYDQIEYLAIAFKPKVLIAGVSAYPRELDYKRFREIADKCGAILMGDMAHIAGLVAGKALKNNPFDYCHVVTTTTHKTLRGPRGAMIFSRNDHKDEIHKKIQRAHFPGLTGGPHNNKIAALAVALGMALQPEFRDYASQVIKNAQAAAQFFVSNGIEVVTGGTDLHMILVNVSKLSKCGMNGSHVQYLADECHISLNMNTVPGDKFALRPSGLRIGTSQLTTRGLKENDVQTACGYILESIALAERVKQSLSSKDLPNPTKDVFLKEMTLFKDEILALKEKCVQFIIHFPIF